MLGLDVDTASSTVLVIEGITGGLVGTWNEQHPDAQVRSGDHIIEVNGVRGDAAILLDKLKNELTLRVVLERTDLKRKKDSSILVVQDDAIVERTAESPRQDD